MLLRPCCGAIVAILLILAACSGGVTSPTEPENAVPATETLSSMARMTGPSGRSGCATVHFNVLGFPSSPAMFTGEVTGDLEGTVELAFVGGPGKFAGVTQHNGGNASWSISDGVLGPLTFDTEFDNKNFYVDRPGSPATVVENIGKHRAVAGVDKANLTFKGEFSFLTFSIDHDFRGVICP